MNKKKFIELRQVWHGDCNTAIAELRLVAEPVGLLPVWILPPFRLVLWRGASQDFFWSIGLAFLSSSSLVWREMDMEQINAKELKNGTDDY
ncbi:MAG: hypothetical protein KJ795_03530 [Gammaproteobacteria bacterium]|nr:hypothetical protein [Gammaproteobacteria bacterium]MBU1775308.1 hypothetical protein [Gammaproteobacteria bacterium]MBU1967842.1 hypothetical protein [Gammaproteobacteria bacterium]